MASDAEVLVEFASASGPTWDEKRRVLATGEIQHHTTKELGGDRDRWFTMEGSYVAYDVAALATLLRESTAAQADLRSLIDEHCELENRLAAAHEATKARADKAEAELAREQTAHAETRKHWMGREQRRDLEAADLSRIALEHQERAVDAEAGLAQARERADRLEAAIRLHRDQRGDDRCHLDDMGLYAALPEGAPDPADLRLCDPLVMMGNCLRFIASRQPGGQPYVSPQRRIEELEAQVAALTACRDEWAGGPDRIGYDGEAPGGGEPQAGGGAG